MANETMRKFGYPETLVGDYRHWAVLLRPAQVTLGSLVLCARSDATSFGALEPDAFSELAEIVPAIERALKSFCDYERINYLMLMMVDPNAHFHVIPRYSEPRDFNGTAFPDTGWPGPPDLKAATALDTTALSHLRYVLAEKISGLDS
jgi:diadenosine tetraphosphate (Ap4A) HIT family hydrolase